MDIKTLYKLISGSPAEVEKVLNVLSQDGWRPVAMSCHGRPLKLTVILENKIMDEAKLDLSSAIEVSDASDAALEEIQ